jgi:hypothetical protein
LIRPLELGNPVPATYEQIAMKTRYSRDGVGDAVGRIDATLPSVHLYPDVVTGKAPERVARLLLEKRSLLA